MSRLLVLLLVLLVTGCAASAHPLYVDSRFSPEEAGEIALAAEYWERASGGTLHVDLVFGADVRIPGGRDVIARLTEAEARATPGFDTRKWGYELHEYGDHGEWVELDPGRIAGGERLRNLAAHELGHYLGLVHSNDARALMYGPWLPTEARGYVDAGCISDPDLLLAMAADLNMSRAVRCAVR